MNHIKLFEELRRETYLSAADKLKAKGHIKRAKALYDRSYELIDRLDPNKYTIDGVSYQIVDIVDFVLDESTCPVCPAIDSKIILQSKSKKISIICGYLEDDCEYEEEDECIVAYENSILKLWYRLDDDDDYEEFKFKNRKDAFNFRKFLIEHFPDDDVISINDMYN